MKKKINKGVVQTNKQSLVNKFKNTLFKLKLMLKQFRVL